MSINAEILMELLADHNVWLNKDTAKKVADDFAGHLSECNFSESKNNRNTTEEVENLHRLIRNLKHENQVYKNSVKERRNASHVYIENGEVKYDLR